jgi:O-antigen/teichoic acid export membrane protein
MQAQRRSGFAAALFGRFAPLGDASTSRTAQPPRDVAGHQINRMVKRGAPWAFGSQVGGQIIRFLSVIVLARLLTPDDYGAASIAISLATFSAILGDLGYGTALVQSAEATQRGASTAYWSALAAGTLCSGCAALGAFPAATLLGEPAVTGLVIVGGSTFFLAAAGSASNALLTRSMSFGVIQGATLAASLVAAASAVTAAALGAGPWALVLQQVVLSALTSALLIISARWRPSLQFSRSAFRSLSKFAMPVTGGTVFGVVQPLIAALLIGHLVGVTELGIWSLSMAVVVIPATLFSYPIARVIYAAFARMRDDPNRIAGVWLNGFTSLAAIALPALFGLIAVAPDVIPLAFGPQWDAAVPVVQILAVFLMVRTLQTWNTPVMDAFGKPHVAMLINAAMLVAVVPGIWYGSRFGIEGVAVAFSVTSFFFGELPSFVITTRALSLSTPAVLSRLAGIVFASAVMCVVVAALRHALDDAGMEIALRVILCVIAGVVTYLVCLTLSARYVMRELVALARGIAPAVRTAQ